MNKLDKDYQNLLQDILDNGIKKEDRTGTGTVSVFGRQIRHKMSDGFPLLTTKKMYMKGIVTELIWFLRADTNIKYLVDNDCHIWDGDAYKSYLSKWSYEKYPNDGSVVNVEPIKVEPHTKEQFIYRIKTDNEFAKTWGDLGKIYGFQWRNWDGTPFTKEEFLQKLKTDKEFNNEFGNKGIDQISELIKQLKDNPDSRRLLVSAWAVHDLPNMTLPPCHYSFQVYTRELSSDERRELVRVNGLCPKYSFEIEDGKPIPNKLSENEWYDKFNIPTRAISLMWNQRSCDFPLGIPYNIASYAILLEIIGKMVNMVPDELIGNLGDCHIYSNQVEGCKEQITREPYKLPKLSISNNLNFNEGIDEFLNSCLITDFKIDGYQSHPTIKFPLSN